MNELEKNVSGLNMAIIRGSLSSPPRRRSLPSGSEMVSYEITATDSDGNRRSVPVVWIDPSRPPGLESGDEVVAVGCVRRRFFRAGGSTQSRTEVEASLVVRAGSPRAVKAVQVCIDRASELNRP